MKFTKVQTPRGAKDILPPDGFRKSRLEARAASFLEGWGYRRVYTPTFEFYDALVQGSGAHVSDTMYRFIDRDGHTLALRPEMTSPIARMAATRYTLDDMPMRLYYVGSVFRYDDPQAGRQREFTQVGVELLGLKEPEADAEVVSLAVKTLESVGLTSFRVDLGHVGFIHSLLQQVGDDDLVTGLREALLARDYVQFEALAKTKSIGAKLKEALLALPTLRGGLETLHKAREIVASFPNALAALDDLEGIYRLVVAYGLDHQVAIDLGIIKDFDYYTGMLLEGYTPGLGFTLCGGGRYDALVGRFGMDCPATGFAFGVERAMLALERQGWQLQEDVPDLFLFTTDDSKALSAAAARLRSDGVRVELGLECRDVESAATQASKRGISTLGKVRADDSSDGYTLERVEVSQAIPSQ